jgi:hypothetical protein
MVYGNKNNVHDASHGERGEAHDDIENEEEMRDSSREMPMPKLREKLIRLGFSREGCARTCANTRADRPIA